MNNLTPRAQETLANARTEAKHLNHNYIGTEHILLAMCRQTILSDITDANELITDIIVQVGAGPLEPAFNNQPYTPRVKKVLALASKEARQLNNAYVGVHHILMGLIKEEGGVAARVLKARDITYEKVLALHLRYDPPIPNKPATFETVGVSQIVGKTITQVIVNTVETAKTTYGAGSEGTVDTKTILTLQFSDGTEFSLAN